MEGGEGSGDKNRLSTVFQKFKKTVKIPFEDFRLPAGDVISANMDDHFSSVWIFV